MEEIKQWLEKHGNAAAAADAGAPFSYSALRKAEEFMVDGKFDYTAWIIEENGGRGNLNRIAKEKKFSSAIVVTQQRLRFEDIDKGRIEDKADGNVYVVFEGVVIFGIEIEGRGWEDISRVSLEKFWNKSKIISRLPDLLDEEIIKILGLQY